MKIINHLSGICVNCFEEHSTEVVRVTERALFQDLEIEFEAEYIYCDRQSSYIENEVQMKKNDIAMKDAYRRALNLLDSSEILAIRSSLSLTAEELSIRLNWDADTLFRYESHEVQDRADDAVLRALIQE